MYCHVRPSLSLLSINGVYSWFSEEKEFVLAHSARWYHFPHSFFSSVIDLAGVLFVASITVGSQTNGFEGKCCGYEVCKHRDCRSKYLGC